MNNYKLNQLLNTPFIDLPEKCLTMENKQQIIRELEGLAQRAGMMAAYILERDGYGCGDQGHKNAIKRMNKTGKTIWMTVFGYNAFHPLSF
jgi:hypothetical protein